MWMIFKSNLKRFLLPGPKELGRSTSDSLPSAFWQSNPNLYTWDSWREEVRIRFPFRFFVWETIPNIWNMFYRPIHHRISDAWYFFKSYTYKKYHIINISQPKGIGYEYKYGFIDSDTKIFLAAFTILRDFVEKENPKNPLDSYSIETIKLQGLEEALIQYKEIMALYDWWMDGRRIDHRRNDESFNLIKDIKDPVERKKFQKKWLDESTALDEKDEEMLCRLMKIRHSLWT